MTQRILLVTHDDGSRADRASRFLVARGHAVEWTCPAQGGDLPEPDGAFDAAIVYGGLDSVNAREEKTYLKAELDWIGRWTATGKPYLGLCLGGQLLAHSLGGGVARHADGLHEHGFIEVRPTAAGREILPGPLHVYQAHYEGFDLAHSFSRVMGDRRKAIKDAAKQARRAQAEKLKAAKAMAREIEKAAKGRAKKSA